MYSNLRKASIIQKTVLLLVSLILGNTAFAQGEEAWKEWLKEVDPIITNTEKSVFASLKTVEDKTRFIDSFWKARDSDPLKGRNEYKKEYYRRINYAKKNLGGIQTDRGRIYLILGEPTDKNTFSGSDQVVDAEMWTYYGNGRPGLPPVMHLIFFKRGNAGNFRLFYPGLDTATDIISPAYMSSGADRGVGAYNEIRKSFGELADATLSIIPGEGTPGGPATATSSSRVLAEIYSLPGKEASRGYLGNFRSIEGAVDVTYATQEMPGFVLTALSRNRGDTFLNYAIAPEVIHLTKLAENQNTAQLHLNLRIESLEGITIHQQEKNIEVRLDDKEKKALEEKKIMFSGFLPVIPGAFNLKILLSNTTTHEFLIYEEKFEINDNTVPFVYGYGTEEIRSGRFMPFSTETQKVLIDPRSVFNKTDVMEGIIFSDQKPSVRLVAVDDAKDSFEVADIAKDEGRSLFRHSLAEAKPGYYHLIVKIGGREVINKIVAVLPFLVARPENYEWTDPPSSGTAYDFEMAAQYLNKGDIQTSLERFAGLPETFWNPQTKPIIARAYYQAKDYEKVVGLLEGKDIIKDYSVLFLLGNSTLELKQLRPAAGYFEQLRAYGDTARVNQVLGAIFLSLGEGEKAKVYFDRAKDLEKKPAAKSEKEAKESNHEE